MALFYSDGGPGPAHQLWRVNVEGGGSDWEEWRSASAHRWNSDGSWTPHPNAQLEINFLGEMGMVDESEVPRVQQEIRDWHAENAR
jgi:hypothetical protein